MTTEEKIMFIRELTTLVIEEEILSKVDRMPKEWDEDELRRFIADEFDWILVGHSLKNNKRKDYDRFMHTHNL